METVDGAQRHLLERIPHLPSETVPLASSWARILAEDVIAGSDLPAWTNASMDGYAVRAAATSPAPVHLPVAGEIRAGDRPGSVLSPSTVMRIMTGAPLPDGADAVVRHEDSDNGRDQVTLRVTVPPGTAVRAAGTDVRRGDIVLIAGRRLRAADMAMCAALQRASVRVGRRPVVGLLSNGDELVDVGATPLPGQLVDSNGVALAALVAEAGGIPLLFGIVGDDRPLIRQRLEIAAQQADIVVSCAGVSAGDHDHVRGAVEDIGSIEVWQIAMRPGRPLVIGKVGDVPFVGLPGNPVSAQVTFELFVRPAILAMQGAVEVHRPRGFAAALEPVTKPKGLETFHRATLVPSADGTPGFRLTGDQNSGRLRSLTDADCLVVLAAAHERIEVGTLVPTITLQ